MRDFEYHAPKTMEEALALIAHYKEEAKIFAGGQSLLVVMKQGLVSPEHIIDIKGLSAMDYVRYDQEKGLRIGALTTHRAIERSPVIKQHFRVLSEMERNLATVQTRNWGTIGGNLCHGDPSGDPAIAFIALGATLKLASLSGERTLDMEAFSMDMLEVALEPGEMLVEILVPVPKPYTGVAHEKLMVLQGDSGIVGAAVSLTLEKGDGVCKDARIALSNAATIPLRAREAEKRLIGGQITDHVLAEAAQVASSEADPPTDMHASEEYRREMLKVLVRRAAKKAMERAKGGLA